MYEQSPEPPNSVLGAPNRRYALLGVGVFALIALLLLTLGMCSGNDAPGDSASSTITTDAAVEGESDADAQSSGSDEGAADGDAGEDDAAPTAVPTSTPAPTPTLWPTVTPLPTVAPPTATPTATPQPERSEPAVRPPGDWTVDVITAKNSTSFVPVYDDNGNEFNLQYTYLNGNTVDYPLLNPTYYNNSLSLLVLEGGPDDDLVLAQLPVRPQGTTGWVDPDLFTWGESDHFVEINVSTNTVRAWDGADLITEAQAVTGSNNRPTPLLEGYIDEKVPGPNGAYGPWVLTLATFSESVNTFGANNGLPKIAMHGTNKPWLIGDYASNGCIRLENDVIQYLAENVPVGTRVTVVRD